MQNQNFEIALKLIIPAILLIFWAVSNLFNRQQNMQQARERNSGLGPRPGGFTPPRDRTSGNASSSFSPPRSQPKSDDIIIIRSETNRPPVRTTAPRRQQGRARPATPRRPDPPPPPKEQLGGRIQSDVNHGLARPLDVRPLNEQIANSVARVDAEAPVGATMGVTITPVASALELFATLASKGRIREAFILNELLQPPISQRRKRQR